MTRRINLRELESLGINHDRDWCHVMARKGAISNIWTDVKHEEFVNDITTGRWHKYKRSYWFEFEQDAIMFKLKFG